MSDTYRLCRQCCYGEDNGQGFHACWAPEKNWQKAKGQPDARICGYKNIKFGEKHFSRCQEVT